MTMKTPPDYFVEVGDVNLSYDAKEFEKTLKNKKEDNDFEEIAETEAEPKGT